MIDEKNTINAGEVLAGDDAEISRLIKGLKRVAAPPDFNVRVRARIASGRPEETSGLRFPVFARYAAAFGAVIVVAGIIGLIWVYKGVGNGGQTVAGPAPVVNQPQVAVPNNNVMVADVPSKTPGEDRTDLTKPLPAGSTKPQSKGPDKESPSLSIPNDGGRTSDDRALHGSREVTPPGVSRNPKRLSKPKEFDNAPQTPATDVLSLLGVSAKFSDGVWRVDSVRATTTAERVGIKAGDIIEYVNDQPMKEKTTFSGASGVFTVKTLRVKRNGQTLKIPLSIK